MISGEERELLSRRISIGRQAEEFLVSDIGKLFQEWIDNGIMGMKLDIYTQFRESKFPAEAELIGRDLGSKYLQGTMVWLQGLIDDGKFALEELKRLENKQDIVVRGNESP